MILIRLIAFIFILLTALPVNAIENLKVIEWDNLLPNMKPLDNPLAALIADQLMDLETLHYIRNERKKGSISEVSEAFEGGVEIRYKMAHQGLDVNELMASYDRLIKEIEKRDQITNTKLDGQLVRIPGYALPLEHKDTGVKKLLLVPYVGACIHVPPPPPNQIIYVTLKDAHVLKDIYEPVWVTCRLSIKTSKQSLTLVDGSAGINTAYTLDGIKIESYKE